MFHIGLAPRYIRLSGDLPMEVRPHLIGVKEQQKYLKKLMVSIMVCF